MGPVITRLLLLVALVALLLPVGAAPAFAHAGGLASSTSEARVLGIDPPIPGLDVRAVEFGARLRMDNGTGAPVVVEPLAGFGALRAPDRRARGARVLDRPARHHRGRRGPPPPDGRPTWAIPLRVGDTPVTVRGEQLWPEPPSALWWAAAAAVLAVVALAGVLGAGGPAGRIALATSTVVVLVAHLLHVLGSAGVPEDRSYLLMVLSAAGYALLGWPLGAIGAWLTLRGRPTGPAAVLPGGRPVRAGHRPGRRVHAGRRRGAVRVGRRRRPGSGRA